MAVLLLGLCLDSYISLCIWLLLLLLLLICGHLTKRTWLLLQEMLPKSFSRIITSSWLGATIA